MSRLSLSSLPDKQTLQKGSKQAGWKAGELAHRVRDLAHQTEHHAGTVERISNKLVGKPPKKSNKSGAILFFVIALAGIVAFVFKKAQQEDTDRFSPAKKYSHQDVSPPEVPAVEVEKVTV